MANVYFKRGTQQELDHLQSYVEGAFYLTSDTDRLYFAQSSNRLADLNQYIHIYTGTSLPSESTLHNGDFYYWTNNNILMVYMNDGTSAGWVQINPDTKVSAATSIVSTTDDTDTVAITTQIQQTQTGGSPITPVSSTFNIVGGSNVHVAVTDGKLVISADNDTTNTRYDLNVVTSANDGQIALHSNDENDTDDIVKFVGMGSVQVTSNSATGEVTIAGQDPLDSLTTSVNNGAFQTTLGFSHPAGHSMNTNAISSNAVTPTIKYGPVTANDVTSYSSATFSDVTDSTAPAAVLDVYSTSQIDAMFESKLSSFDAMQYKGTVSTSDAATKLNPSTANVGDTYKASEAITLSSPAISAQIGDLIIASGTDHNVTWEVVPSGNEQLIQIQAIDASNLVQLKDNNAIETGRTQIIGGIQLVEDSTATKAPINISTTTTSGTTQFTLSHGSAGTGTPVSYEAATAVNGRIQVTGTSLTVPAISAISLDANGHVSSITAVNYTLQDTHASLQSATSVHSASNNTGTASISYKLDSDASAKTAAVRITSDNLKVTALQDNSAIKVNLEWESF